MLYAEEIASLFSLRVLVLRQRGTKKKVMIQ